MTPESAPAWLPGGGADAVLFDFDGTLVLSEERNARIWQKLLAEIGVVLTDQERRSLVGRRLEESAADFEPVRRGSVSIAELGDRYHRLDEAEPRPPVTLAPGADDVLSALRRRGVALGVVTSARSPQVRRDLADAGALDAFAVIVGSDMVASGKPHPEPYRRACELLAVAPARAIAVEDSPVGLASALAAGLRAIGITSTHARAELSHADAVVDGFAQLDTLLAPALDHP